MDVGTARGVKKEYAMSETLGWNRVDFVLTPMLEFSSGAGLFYLF